MLVKIPCPGCGKSLSISAGSTHTCTRCGTKITCDSNGRVIGKLKYQNYRRYYS